MISGKHSLASGEPVVTSSGEPVVKEYTISEADVKGPFLEKIPAKMSTSHKPPE